LKFISDEIPHHDGKIRKGSLRTDFQLYTIRTLRNLESQISEPDNFMVERGQLRTFLADEKEHALPRLISFQEHWNRKYHRLTILRGRCTTSLPVFGNNRKS
jgi:transposase-like protein